MWLTFAQLYAAHLVADFLLQPRSIVEGKRRWRPLLLHAAVHVACGFVLVNVALNPRSATGIAALAVFHVLVDHVKARINPPALAGFVADQLVHLISVFAVAAWLSPADWPSLNLAGLLLVRSLDVYVVLGTYVGIVFGGGFLIQLVLNDRLATIGDALRSRKPGLPRAGTYIGWAERALVLTFFLAGFEEAIGFLIAVKALARYPELKDDAQGVFADYFLVGTLASISIGVVGGLILRQACAPP
ncbi:MAG TPA: DUF3307 domain-containing protein [Candidatus Eisenbacteria bacterium]|nr:DUF3307 domain-containing protein [Candidatus Eisenbacteria bacterium]